MGNTVFISYSHDNIEHLSRVLTLSNNLREEGFDCVLDQYEIEPPEGWPRWMDNEIRKAQFVLMICTETYYKRVMGLEAPGTGKGVKWEGNLIYNHFYNSDSLNDKFIPVLFEDCKDNFIPTPFQGASRFYVDTKDGYADLLVRLENRPKAEKPPLGKRRSQPAREAKSDIAMYVAAPIDIELWNTATWRATFFMLNKERPPVLGVAFANRDAARKIFIDWQSRFKKYDKNNELRVSIIEGAVANSPPGYTVHIGPNVDSLAERYKEYGFDKSKDVMMCISRMNRMDCNVDFTGLRAFEREYRKYNLFYLMPGVFSSENTVTPINDLTILKNELVFRNVDDIKKNDLDYTILNYHLNISEKNK